MREFSIGTLRITLHTLPQTLSIIHLNINNSEPLSMSNKPLVFAHRGAKAIAPENTLPAFAKALEMGVDGIELDVHSSRDGQLAVIHNFSVNKLTNRRGLVRHFTAAQLAEMDAGSHLSPQFAGTGIPTLDQVFDLVGNRCLVNVEIKSNSPSGGEETNLLAAMIAKRHLYDQVIVSSFNAITLIRLHSLDPKVQLGFLYYLPMPTYVLDAWFTSVMQPQALHPYHKLVNADLIRYAQSKGCAVNTWTINDLDEAKRLADLGVTTIMSDVPDQMMAGLRSGS